MATIKQVAGEVTAYDSPSGPVSKLNKPSSCNLLAGSRFLFPTPDRAPACTQLRVEALILNRFRGRPRCIID